MKRRRFSPTYKNKARRIPRRAFSVSWRVGGEVFCSARLLLLQLLFQMWLTHPSLPLFFLPRLRTPPCRTARHQRPRPLFFFFFLPSFLSSFLLPLSCRLDSAPALLWRIPRSEKRARLILMPKQINDSFFVIL